MAASPATTPKKAAAARFVSRSEVSREMQEEYHEFVIRNFSSQPHGVGERILSPDFELCGHKWFVEVFTGGYGQVFAGWLSAFLNNRGDAITADYKFELFSGVPSADSVPIWSSVFCNRSFLAMGTQTAALNAQGKFESWGVGKTLQRDDLINRAVDDTITLRVTVLIGRAKIVQCATAAATRHPEPAHKTLIRDFGALLETGDGSDVVLRADGRDFKAHKTILSARSRVLRAMFGGRFKEGIRSTTSASASSSTAAAEEETKDDGVVELGEVDAETLGRMLRFIYTGSVASSSSGDAVPAGGGDEEEEEGADAGIGVSGWMRLLNAADRFDVGDLFEVAQWRLAEMLTTTAASSSPSSASTPTEQRQRNALECLGLATRLPMGAETLKTAALDVLVRDGVPDDAELPWEMSKEIMKHLNVLRPAAAPAAKSQSDDEEEEEEEEEPATKRRASRGRGGRRSRK